MRRRDDERRHKSAARQTHAGHSRLYRLCVSEVDLVRGKEKRFNALETQSHISLGSV